jgi:hypothetical protein
MFVQVEQTLLVLMGRVLHLTIKLNLFSRLNLKTIEGKSRVKKSRYRTVPYRTVPLLMSSRSSVECYLKRTVNVTRWRDE